MNATEKLAIRLRVIAFSSLGITPAPWGSFSVELRKPYLALAKYVLRRERQAIARFKKNNPVNPYQP